MNENLLRYVHCIVGGSFVSSKVANLLFILATVGWGSSYLFTKFAVTEVLPFALIAFRFIIAFVVTFAIFHKRLIHIQRGVLRASFILGAILCGVFVAFGYVMRIVSPSSAGFLIATTVIFVPIISVLFTRLIPSRQTVLGSLVTFFGLLLFKLKDSIEFDSGTILCLLTAFLFALHIVVNHTLTKKYDALQLGIYQLGFAGALGLLGMIIYEPITYPTSAIGWTAIAVLALICSAFGFVVQSVVQKHTSAEKTGFILALEPIFSAIFAYMALGDTLNEQEWVGAAFIFIGVLIANYVPKKRAKRFTIQKTSE